MILLTDRLKSKQT